MWALFKNINFLKISLLLFLAGFLFGCDRQQLLEGLSQAQATEVVSFLSQNGISAKLKKEDSSKSVPTYSVDVKDTQYSIAVVLIDQNNFPRKEEPTFTDTISQKGILPNSREMELLRVDRAKAAEIEETIKVDPRIEMVRVIVKSTPNPSVSALIRKKNNTHIVPDDFLPLLTKLVPGATAESTSVMVLDSDPMLKLNGVEGIANHKGIKISVPLVPFLGLFMIPDGDSSALSLILLGLILTVAVLSGFVGYWFGFLQKTRKQLDEEAILSEIENQSVKSPRLPKL
jgi:type III secretory pathway lipoprotein EscJ